MKSASPPPVAPGETLRLDPRSALPLHAQAERVFAGLVLIVGCGARLIHPGHVLIYADLARWETQRRFRRNLVNQFEVLAQGVVNVPGYTAHRTVNTGTVPLTYIGVYLARAGHDCGAIAQRNFRCVVVARDGRPTLFKRSTLL